MNLFPTFSKATSAVKEKLRDVLEFITLRSTSFGRAPRTGYGRLPGSNRNWEMEAGNVWDNSAVSLLLRWFCNTFCEAPLTVQRQAAEGDETVLMHDLTIRIKRPNKHFTRTQLFKATLLSYFVDGNSYWWKRRSLAGKVVELWWIPHWLIDPRSSDNEAEWLEGGDAFVSYYEYSIEGSITRIAPVDIIHFKEGVDPANIRKGLSPLKALFREICTDNQILTYTYGILKNFGVPPYTLAPDFSNGPIEMGEDTADKIKRRWKGLTTGDNAGDVMVLTTPWKIEKLGFSPNDLAIGDIGALGEARLAGAFGIPAVTVGLLVGLREANAKASHKEAKLQAYESGIMPVQRDFCETLDLHLLPDLGNEMLEYCEFNTSEVAALKENQNEIAKRADDGFKNNVITLNEARTARGLPLDDDLDGYAWEIVPQSSLGGQLDSALDANGKPVDDPKNEDQANKAARLAIRKAWAAARFKRAA